MTRLVPSFWNKDSRVLVGRYGYSLVILCLQKMCKEVQCGDQEAAVTGDTSILLPEQLQGKLPSFANSNWLWWKWYMEKWYPSLKKIMNRQVSTFWTNACSRRYFSGGFIAASSLNLRIWNSDGVFISFYVFDKGIQGILIKFADDMKLGGLSNTTE